MKNKEMKSSSLQKRQWLKPNVTTLDIKKDTFSGTNPGKESPNKPLKRPK
ncbi:MAG: hypothetical protein ABFS05_13335 [Bacteroidota bacterium]